AGLETRAPPDEPSTATEARRTVRAMAGRLSGAQADAYWRDGFVCVRGLFAGDEIMPWLARTRALASGAVTPPAPMQLVRDVMTAKGVVAPPTPEHAVCKIN